MNESWRAGAPVPFLSINTVGQTIMQFGTQEQKDFFLPKILAGDRSLLDRLHRAGLGHRPGVAQDEGRQGRRRVGDQRPEDLHLAAPATPTTSGWRHAPTRMRRSTGASRSSRCRRPTRASRYSKIDTMVNASTFNTFYDDVRVPDSAIIGELNRGGTSSSTSSTTSGSGSRRPACVERIYEDVVDVGQGDQASRRAPA